MLGRGVITSRTTLVAELHHRLDQLAVFLFDQSFFGAGGDQRLDVFRGSGRLLTAVLFIGDLQERIEEIDYASYRFHRQRETAQQGYQRREPTAGRALVRDLRYGIAGNEHQRQRSTAGFEKSRPRNATAEERAQHQHTQQRQNYVLEKGK